MARSPNIEFCGMRKNHIGRDELVISENNSVKKRSLEIIKKKIGNFKKSLVITKQVLIITKSLVITKKTYGNYQKAMVFT